MTNITIDSVCTKGPIYPMLLHFENGCPKEDFEITCTVLQDRNGNRQVATELNEVVYAGKEEKEDLGKTMILARNRKTGKTRLIEMGHAKLKLFTKSDLDLLQQQHEAGLLNLSRNLTKKHEEMAVQQQLKDDEVVQKQMRKLSAANDTLDRLDSTVRNLKYNQGYTDMLELHEDSSLSKNLAQRHEEMVPQKKIKVDVVDAKQKNFVTAVVNDTVDRDENNLEDFYLPTINREATKVEDVYCIDQIFTKDEQKMIYWELEGNNCTKDLHPYIQSLVKGKILTPKQTVAAMYASELIKFKHLTKDHIKKKDFMMNHHSKTLNDILIKQFTKIVKNRHKYSPGGFRFLRIKSKQSKDRVICDVIMSMLILNDHRLQIGPLCTVLNQSLQFIKNKVSLLGASIVINDEEVVIETEQKNFVTAVVNDTVDSVDSSVCNENDLEDFYLPTINRDATRVEDVYCIDQIFTKDEQEKIYWELEGKDFTKDLHPYVQSLVKGKILTPKQTVLAVYASELIKFKHLTKDHIKKKDFMMNHHSKTLNDILIKQFTKIVKNRHKYSPGGFRFLRIKSKQSKDRVICDVIMSMLILNDHKLQIGPLCTVLNQSLQFIKNKVSLLGASIVINDEEIVIETEQKNFVTAVVNDTVDSVDSSVCNENDLEDFYLPTINREATRVVDVYCIDQIFTKDEQEKIYWELEGKDFTKDLHPYVQSLVKGKILTPKQTVLAVYASELIKFKHLTKDHIKKKDFMMNHHSKTLNDILIKQFTKMVKNRDQHSPGGFRFLRIKSKQSKDRVICDVIMSMLILNDYKLQIGPLCTVLNQTLQFIKNKVSLLGAPIVINDEEIVIETEQKNFVTAVVNDTVDSVDSSVCNENDLEDFYLPTINREATRVVDVYCIDQIFTKDEQEKIYWELEGKDFTKDLHPYVQSLVKGKILTPKQTVLAVYASELIKFKHLSMPHIRKKHFIMTHLSYTINNILINRLTNLVKYRSPCTISGFKFVRVKSKQCKNRVICDVIISMLILNDYKLQLGPLCTVLNQSLKFIKNKVSLLGASIVTNDGEMKVELKLPLVQKHKSSSLESSGKFESNKQEKQIEQQDKLKGDIRAVTEQMETIKYTVTDYQHDTTPIEDTWTSHESHENRTLEIISKEHRKKIKQQVDFKVDELTEMESINGSFTVDQTSYDAHDADDETRSSETSKFNSKKHKKKIKRQNTLKVDVKTIRKTEQMENVTANVTDGQLDISYGTNSDSDDLYILPMNRKSRKVNLNSNNKHGTLDRNNKNTFYVESATEQMKNVNGNVTDDDLDLSANDENELVDYLQKKHKAITLEISKKKCSKRNLKQTEWREIVNSGIEIDHIDTSAYNSNKSDNENSTLDTSWKYEPKKQKKRTTGKSQVNGQTVTEKVGGVNGSATDDQLDISYDTSNDSEDLYILPVNRKSDHVKQSNKSGKTGKCESRNTERGDDLH